MTVSPSPRKPLSAGSEIDAWCTRCKLDLGHRIVAMVGSAPKRVICLTCGSEHNYRAPKSETRKTVGAARAPQKKASGGTKISKAAALAHSEWETAVRSGKPFRDYSISQKFQVGDLIRHKKFGEGYVVAQIGPQKLTVAFSSGEKTLIHDQGD
jgi:hypothetical protein